MHMMRYGSRVLDVEPISQRDGCVPLNGAVSSYGERYPRPDVDRIRPPPRIISTTISSIYIDAYDTIRGRKFNIVCTILSCTLCTEDTHFDWLRVVERVKRPKVKKSEIRFFKVKKSENYSRERERESV